MDHLLLAKRLTGRLLKKEKRLIEEKGIFENAGYRLYPKMLDLVSNMCDKYNLTYSQRCDIEEYFNRACDKLGVED